MWPGQRTLLNYCSPKSDEKKEEKTEEKTEGSSPQRKIKQASKRSLFSEEKSKDDIAAKELEDVRKMAEDGLLSEFSQDFDDCDDCEPCAPKKAKLY